MSKNMLKNIRKRANLKINLLVTLLILSLILGLYRTILKPNRASKNKSVLENVTTIKKKGIYVLEIFAPIQYTGENSIFMTRSGVKYWVKQIEKCAKDDSITGLLLRVNSPGGTIAATQEMYEALKRFKATGKKLVVSVIDVCASGAYYISLPADVIVANPGSIVGSIGVIISSPDISELLKKWGIKFNTIKSGKNKDILSASRKITEQEKLFLQDLVDEMHGQFLAALIEWRAKYASKKSLTALADGRIFSATRAKSNGLVDQIGDFDVAKKTLARLCNLDEDDIVIKNWRPDTPFNFDFIFNGFFDTLIKTWVSQALEQASDSDAIPQYHLP